MLKRYFSVISIILVLIFILSPTMSQHRGLLHHMILRVSNLERSSLFYRKMFEYLGYELADSRYEGDFAYEDWKRWDLETPHEISICQVEEALEGTKHTRGAVGHHDHIAFCASSREDVDRFYEEILVPLAKEGLCEIEDPPCDCPEYGEGYYATFFFDPDGLKYEFVINPNHIRKKEQRAQDRGR